MIWQTLIVAFLLVWAYNALRSRHGTYYDIFPIATIWYLLMLVLS